MMEEEQSVLRWGGLAGIAGGILLVAVVVIVGVFVGPDPAEPEGLVMRFPDVRAAHIVEEVLYLGVLALWAIHFLALYRALRGTSLAPALRAVRERTGHHGSRRARGRCSSAGREDPALRPLSCSWGEPRGSGDTRPHVAGDPGHIRCVARRRTPPPAHRCHCPRGGHAGVSGLWQGCWRGERGDRGIGGRSRGCPADRSWLSYRHRQHSVTHRLSYRLGMEGLQAVEGPVRGPE